MQCKRHDENGRALRQKKDEPVKHDLPLETGIIYYNIYKHFPLRVCLHFFQVNVPFLSVFISSNPEWERWSLLFEVSWMASWHLMYAVLFLLAFFNIDSPSSIQCRYPLSPFFFLFPHSTLPSLLHFFFFFFFSLHFLFLQFLFFPKAWVQFAFNVEANDGL